MERGLDLSGSGEVQVADCFNRGNEPSGSVKQGEYIDLKRNCELISNYSAQWS
jgi:hypothetical protein